MRCPPAAAEALLKQAMPIGGLRVGARDGMVYIDGVSVVRMLMISPINHSIDQLAIDRRRDQTQVGVNHVVADVTAPGPFRRRPLRPATCRVSAAA